MTAEPERTDTTATTERRLSFAIFGLLLLYFVECIRRWMVAGGVALRFYFQFSGGVMISYISCKIIQKMLIVHGSNRKLFYPILFPILLESDGALAK